jgi:hypothetical protein
MWIANAKLSGFLDCVAFMQEKKFFLNNTFVEITKCEPKVL